MFAAARWIVYRDLLLAVRRWSDVATALLFFIIVASLFPLGVGAEPNLLRAIAPGVIWVAALLSTMLSLGRLFAADHAGGTPERELRERRGGTAAGEGAPEGAHRHARRRPRRRPRRAGARLAQRRGHIGAPAQREQQIAVDDAACRLKHRGRPPSPPPFRGPGGW